jgi:uncharacterized protein YdaU (DUF1376 family)
MSQAPYMKLWCSDFLGDTLHLTPAEVGQYMLILMAMWNNGGSLPKTKINRVARSRVGDEVMTFFEIDGCDVTNKRLTTELENAQRFSDSQRQKANAKHLKDKEQASAGAVPEVCHHSHSHSHREDKKEKEIALKREFAEDFWPEFPNKVGKPVACQAFLKTRKRFSLGAIMEGLRRYMADKPPDRQWLNPATFLNQERFLDEPAPAATSPPRVSATTLAGQKLEEKLNGNGFGGPALRSEHRSNVVRQLAKPTARSRDVFDANDYSLHREAEIITAKSS